MSHVVLKGSQSRNPSNMPCVECNWPVQAYQGRLLQALTGVSDAQLAEAGKPHEYEKTVPYNGCGRCGFGPGAIQHNVANARLAYEKRRRG